MPHLLVQSCSKSKKDGTEPRSAFELYSGYYYKIIKKAMREGRFRNDIDICILSAKHGILDPDEEIECYDRRMDATRAEELRAEVHRDLQSRLGEKSYDSIVFNLGQAYEHAIKGFECTQEVDVRHFEGQLGIRGSKLKEFVRIDQSLAFN